MSVKGFYLFFIQKYVEFFHFDIIPSNYMCFSLVHICVDINYFCFDVI